DNGAYDATGPLAGLTLTALLETLKPAFDQNSPEAEAEAFQNAMGIARAFVEAAIGKHAAKLRAEAVVMEAIRAAGESRVLELPMGMPFRPAIEKAGAEYLLFVVHPRDKDWCHTGMRRGDEGFEL